MPKFMEVLTFHIKGKFAHFRKFHGNNTAMSYSIPPRTTIIGILAAVLGEENDTYYQKFRTEKLLVGVRVLEDLKKSFHRLNYLKITSRNDFTGQSGRIQTPFEIVTAYDLKRDLVCYKIYLAAGKDPALYDNLKNQLLSDKRTFNISLGIAGFSAFISEVESVDVTPIHADSEWVDLHSACNSDQVLKIDFPEDPEIKFNHIEEELLPADFIGGEKGREVYRMNRVLFATRPFPIHVKLDGTYYQLPGTSNESENIQFLEYASVLTQPN
ncbi:MAG: CRISPR-associated protein Cas5 [Candidatus Babeliales bacterium]